MHIELTLEEKEGCYILDISLKTNGLSFYIFTSDEEKDLNTIKHFIKIVLNFDKNESWKIVKILRAKGIYMINNLKTNIEYGKSEIYVSFNINGEELYIDTIILYKNFKFDNHIFKNLDELVSFFKKYFYYDLDIEKIDIMLANSLADKMLNKY